MDDRDTHQRMSGLPLAEAGGVLLGDHKPLHVRHDAEHGHTGPALQERRCRRQEGCVATELVQDEPAHQRPLVRSQPLPRPEQRREHATAVDVADQKHVGLGVQRQAHVDDVARPQVDLRRTTSALG